MSNSSAPAQDVKVRCRPIGEADLDAVALLLARGFEKRPIRYFRDGLARQAEREVPAGLPRFGYLLEASGRPVGAVLLMFSERRDPPEIRCNIASWYVDPPYRGHAAWLSSMALKHKGVTYLNVTPAPNTWPILEAQGYRRYCDGLFFAFPALLPGPRGIRVETVGPDHAAIDGLSDDEMRTLRDQAAYGCTSLVAHAPDGPKPFVFLPFRMRSGRIPLPLMQLVFCRDPEDFVAVAGPLARRLLRAGRLGVIMDARGPVPGLPGLYTERRGRKYFKGPGSPRLADLADTELVLFGF